MFVYLFCIFRDILGESKDVGGSMRVGIYTLGCKVNLYESEYVVSLLKEHGYEVVSFDEICDIYIINTCTVTNTSDIKSKKIIRQAIRKNPDACIIAMGCFIEANQEIEIPGVDIFIGTKNKSKIVSYIETFFKERNQLRMTSKKGQDEFEDMEIKTFEGRTRAFVKIQDGCENFCSYCIIPFVRGKCRSKKFDVVVDEITRLVRNGYREIVLTGIHTGNYGVDIGTDFATLLEAIVKIEGLERLRISSIEITELNNRVLEVIKNNPVIVDHLHIPLQSGSKSVLKNMDRKYDKKFFLEKVEKIRTIRPHISLTTDVIVGFPGETEEDFLECLDFIKQINFSKIHVFPYSVRTGTKASCMENQVDEITKKERVKRLLALSRELEQNYMEQFLGKIIKVLVEVSHDGYSLGHTENYLLVRVDGTYESETIIEVEITEIEYPFCQGKVVSQ